MKIASFNANGIRARREVILKWLKRHNPDILGIQETKVQNQDFPLQPFTAAGYHCSFTGEKSYNGVAVLSREKPEDVRVGLGEQEPEEARLITATIGGIHVANAYVPQGQEPSSEKFKYKISWLGRLKIFFETHFNHRDPLILLGDLNVAPQPIDVYDPEKLLGSVGYHPEEHRALQNVKDWGFEDVYRRHKPEEKAYTFWDYRIPQAARRGLGWRIDHIWATRCMAERSADAWIDTETRLGPRPSDHTFIVAEFE